MHSSTKAGIIGGIVHSKMLYINARISMITAKTATSSFVILNLFL